MQEITRVVLGVEEVTAWKGRELAAETLTPGAWGLSPTASISPPGTTVPHDPSTGAAEPRVPPPSLLLAAAVRRGNQRFPPWTAACTAK